MWPFRIVSQHLKAFIQDMIWTKNVHLSLAGCPNYAPAFRIIIHICKKTCKILYFFFIVLYLDDSLICVYTSTCHRSAAGQLTSLGMRRVAEEDQPDLVLLNTCSIRDKVRVCFSMRSPPPEQQIWLNKIYALNKTILSLVSAPGFGWNSACAKSHIWRYLR